MKRLSILGSAVMAIFLFKSPSHATVVQEAPISYAKAGTAITVSVSTSAWTLSNTATSYVAQRGTIVVTNPAANSAVIEAICHASAPTEAITVRINEIGPGMNRQMPCGGGLNLYLLSLGSAAQNIGVWEVGQ